MRRPIRARMGDSRMAGDRGESGGSERRSSRYTRCVICVKRPVGYAEDDKG